MFQTCFLSYYDFRCQNIQEHVPQASRYCDPKAIHDLRVEIKQLRAFSRLIEYLHPEYTAKKHLRTIRKVFKAAGPLRDAHVQQQLARTWAQEMGMFLYAYYNALKQKELAGRNTFLNFIDHSNLDAQLRKNRVRVIDALQTLSNDDAEEKLMERLNDQLRQILEHGRAHQHREEHLHKLRILAKETRYMLDIAQRCFCGDESWKILSDHLRGLHQALGKWHDGDVAKEHLEKFVAEQDATSDDTLINQLTQRIDREKATHFAAFEQHWNDFVRFMEQREEDIRA